MEDFAPSVSNVDRHALIPNLSEDYSISSNKRSWHLFNFEALRNNSNIGAYYLNSGGLHRNDKGLGRLAINLKLKIRTL